MNNIINPLIIISFINLSIGIADRNMSTYRGRINHKLIIKSFWKTENIIPCGKLYCIFCVSVFIIWRWSTKRGNSIRSRLKSLLTDSLRAGSLVRTREKLFWLRNRHPARKSADSYSVATYLLQQRNLWKGNLKCAQALGKEGGKVASRCAFFFLPSLRYTSNSLNPSHQSQPIQRSDRVGVWEKWLFLHFSSILQSILVVRWRLRA